MADRNKGNPNLRTSDREESRTGRERTPENIPKQASKTRFREQASNVTSYVQTATYAQGVAKRPSSIKHDNGFLTLGKSAPTSDDYLKLAKWKAMLEGAEAIRPDLTDALAAYRHFLEGNGQARIFLYDRYIMNDNSGKLTLRNAILDIQQGAVDLWHNNKKPTTFELTGSVISCGSSPQFPYPDTENWQKAIGGHLIWLSGKVTVTGGKHTPPNFKMVMTLHAEDRYNFNPFLIVYGQQDIATGIPDSDNGRFEITGLGHQYDHFSTTVRVITWRGAAPGVTSSDNPNTDRKRQPDNNRRLRNRI